MKAITVIESDDGEVTVASSGVNEDTVQAIDLLHRGIEVIASRLRWVIEKGGHGDIQGTSRG